MEALKQLTLQGMAFLATARVDYWTPLHPLVKTVIVVLAAIVLIAVVF